MASATAQANPNLALIKFTLAKLDWTNAKVWFSDAATLKP